MVTFEELVGKFKLVNVTPYGACIIVPGEEFDHDWEAVLADQGCRFHFVELAGKAVTLVQKGTKLKDAGKNSARALGVATPKVEKPPEEKLKDPRTNLLAKLWSSDDEQNLLKRIDALPGTIEQKCIRLSREFIGRSPAAIHQKYVKLQRKMKGSGRIGRPKKRAQGPAESEPAPTSVHTPVCNVSDRKQPIEPAGPVKDPILSVLEEIRNLLINQFKPEPVTFKAYCRKCKYSQTIRDDEVWRLCPRCGEPLIIWNVEVKEASA
jgi:predicted RNA-binding Zn-ribbon protein involved in translation (DUF1610 family)